MKEDVVARLVVREISDMSAKERERLIDWLLRQVDNVRIYHTEPGFSAKYTARLMRQK